METITENGCSATGMTWTSIVPPASQCIPGSPDCRNVTIPEPSPLARLAVGMIGVSQAFGVCERAPDSFERAG